MLTKRININPYLIICLFFSVNLSIDFKTIDSHEENHEYDMEFKKIQMIPNEKDPELLWRMARAYFNQAEKQYNQEEKNNFFYSAYNYSKQALNLDSNLAKANHWYAVLHGQIGLVEGTKQKIINSYDVLKYGKIAIDLDPSYDNTHHLLGRLNFELANLSWLEKNLASWVYETPPKGSFEEARDYFEAAIKLNPEDIRHLLWLGKTYIALEEKNKAQKLLTKVISLEPKDQKDKDNIKKATILLNEL